MNVATMIGKKPLIRTVDLSKRYGNLLVLDKFNLKIYPGDRIALLGVNGSGKTTLMEILLGLLPKSEGQIHYLPSKKAFLTNSLAIFQVGAYPAKMKVRSLIRFYQDFYPRPLGMQESYRLARILNLTSLLNKKVNNLSFGQKKKVEALLTLSVESDFYFVDEITAGVDIDARVQIPAMFLKKLQTDLKKGMLWITHDPNEIEKLCNRVILLSKNNQNIYFDGTVAQAKKRFQSIQQMLEVHFRQELTETLAFNDE